MQSYGSLELITAHHRVNQCHEENRKNLKRLQEPTSWRIARTWNGLELDEDKLTEKEGSDRVTHEWRMTHDGNGEWDDVMRQWAMTSPIEDVAEVGARVGRRKFCFFVYGYFWNVLNCSLIPPIWPGLREKEKKKWVPQTIFLLFILSLNIFLHNQINESDHLPSNFFPFPLLPSNFIPTKQSVKVEFFCWHLSTSNFVKIRVWRYSLLLNLNLGNRSNSSNIF